MKVYRTAPQQERKARDEIRRAGIKAYVPLEDRTRKDRRRFKHPVAPGYVFADSKPPEAKYVKASIGQIERNSISPLYVRRQSVKQLAKPMLERPLRKGDRVIIAMSTGNKSGLIVQARGRACVVQIDGATHTVSVSTTRVMLDTSKTVPATD